MKTEEKNNMIHVPIRPLSINEGYTGKRWKTATHRAWHHSVLFLLPKHYPLPEPPLKIFLTFGITDRFDWDNGIKFICDVIAEKYKFNDKIIRSAAIETEPVLRGEEFFEFSLQHHTKTP